jgi:hypothetical protein
MYSKFQETAYISERNDLKCHALARFEPTIFGSEGELNDQFVCMTIYIGT